MNASKLKDLLKTKSIRELSDKELSSVSSGMFVDYKFGVVYYSSSEWNQMSLSEQQAIRLFFDGDVKVCVLPDSDYEAEYRKYNPGK